MALLSIQDVDDTSRKRGHMIELTHLSRQWEPADDPPPYGFWMASSEVDQKFLGHFAKTTSIDNNYLSSFLYRVLGLSVILSEQLYQARRARQNDPIKTQKDKTFNHHILWLAREGLVMVEQYVLPMVGNYVELKVLAYKLRASFYHIFVLFHNNPPVNSIFSHVRTNAGGAQSQSLYPDPLQTRNRSSSSRGSNSRGSPSKSVGGPVGGRVPPGLPIPGQITLNSYDAATFILPSEDYTPRATNAFVAANSLAESLLPGSHPVRLSVKVEYVAYLYDCLAEYDQSRRTAKLAIRQVYEAQEGMDDESFEDAAEMVGMLGRMMNRGKTPQAQTQALQQALGPPSSAPPNVKPPPIPTKSPKHGKSASQSAGQSQSPARGRRRANSTTQPTTQPTTWV